MAATSSVEGRGAACDQSVSRTSRRFEERAPIDRQPKRDAHKPPAKPRAIAQAFKAPVRAKQRFLRHVFRIRAVAQHAARDAIRQRPAFREPLLEFPPESSRSRFLREFFLSGTAWLDQNQLLH